METKSVKEFIEMVNANKQVGIQAIIVDAGSKTYTFKNFENLEEMFGERQCILECRPYVVDGLKTASLKLV